LELPTWRSFIINSYAELSAMFVFLGIGFIALSLVSASAVHAP
jgi:hypothetical protein